MRAEWPSAPNVQPLLVADPAEVGAYRLLGRLGEGGMGAVYLGLSGAGRKVAVKVIRRDLAVDPSFRARFDTEVANAQRVASFCTARVLDHGAAGGQPYMVTEYIEGPSLADYVEMQGTFPAGPLRSLAIGAATALTAIHAVRLVHRDFKPRNVLLSATGPRVIDFGIARALDSTSHHTQTGAVVGSPGWLAPEQLFGGQTSTAIDVFAWGTLVAYAAAGRHPYGTGNLMMLATRAQQRGYDLTGVPPPLLPLIAAALEPNPANRPSAEEILARLVGGENPMAAAGNIISREWTAGDLLMPGPGRPGAVRDATSQPGPAAPPAGQTHWDPVAPGTRQPRRRTWLATVLAAAATALVVGGLGAGGLALQRAGENGAKDKEQGAEARPASATAQQQITKVAAPCGLVSPALLNEVSPDASVEPGSNVGRQDLGRDGAETKCDWGTLDFYRSDSKDSRYTHLIVKVVVRRDGPGRNGVQEAARDFVERRSKVQKAANTKQDATTYGPFSHLSGIGDESYVVTAMVVADSVNLGEGMVRFRYKNANVEVRYTIGYSDKHKKRTGLDLVSVRDEARKIVEKASRDVVNNLASCADCRT